MKVTAYEGIVSNGRVHLTGEVHLPDNARVFVVVPEADALRSAQIPSPRLAHSEQAVDFKKKMIEAPADGAV